LYALINRPESISPEKWGEPYLTRPIHDLWKHEFIYLRDDGSSFKLFSLGEDGISNSQGKDIDDINTWDKGKRWHAYYGVQADEQEVKRRMVRIAIDCLYILLFGYLLIRLIQFNLMQQSIHSGDDL